MRSMVERAKDHRHRSAPTAFDPLHHPAGGPPPPTGEGGRRYPSACHMPMTRPNARMSPVVVPAILFMA